MLAGVLGWPIHHSKSPVLHGHWLRRYGIDGAYLPMAVRPNSLRTAVDGLRALGFRGCNVTIPHKEAVAALADLRTPTVERLGSANTLVFREDGSLWADSTDGYGFIENLKQGADLSRLRGGTVVMLGAGGAARPVIGALLEQGVSTIRLSNRSPEKAEAIADLVGSAVQPVPWAEREAAVADCALLVNTTSLGMVGQPALEMRLDDLPPDALVTDLVYAPLETTLLGAARTRGNPVVDGLGMLLHQARPGFHAWFGTDPDVDDDLRSAVLSS